MIANWSCVDSTPTLNIPYSRKVLEHLIAHPEEHDQTVFGGITACGTKTCIAGAAVIMDPDSRVLWVEDQMAGVIANGHGGVTSVDERARTLLGLSLRDANDLFYTYDNEGALKTLAALITAAEAVQYD